ncbi:MAG: hypothetical protein ABIS50_04590 [Luteolibacter sp.]|uniref:hypothetical protein n=1 Tax=Luteolibacter sp. TaxID=1962973 RepID=UPI003266B75F
MKYRPSKGFILTVLPLAALVVSFGFGLLPELEEFEARPIPGEITFSHAKPEVSGNTTVSARKITSFRWSMDWFEESYEDLMEWKHNPWKRNPDGFGGHTFELLGSKDPRDQAKASELRRLVEACHQKLLLRFPELAVTMKSIPDDQNGFLKWLDLLDKIKAANPKVVPGIDFPKELDDYFNHQGAWNAETAKTWLAQQKLLVDEIHAIGLLPEQSVNGIPIDRWGFIAARFGKNCEEILVLEARVAAEQGDVAAALESVRAAKGLADHFIGIETPTLLAATVNILMQLNLENHVLRDIIPALPAGQVDPAVWEKVLNPTVSSPAEFARLMKGEWSASNRQWLLPFLLDAEGPDCPPDGGDALDFYALRFLETVRSHETATLTDLPTLELPPMSDPSHLSRSSRRVVEILSIGASAWRKGWDCSQSKFAMTQAAFAIMEGQPIPQEPVYGKDYQWDPATRQLSMPAGKEFEDLKIKPITVPKY